MTGYEDARAVRPYIPDEKYSVLQRSLRINRAAGGNSVGRVLYGLSKYHFVIFRMMSLTELPSFFASDSVWASAMTRIMGSVFDLRR